MKSNLAHQFSTRVSNNSFVESQLVYSPTRLSVSSRGPRLWNKLLDQQHKSLDHETSFEKPIKLTPLSLENEDFSKFSQVS